MEQIIANLLGKVRRESLKGREFLVVPASLIVPGVLNGSKGPLYYPLDEISKNPGGWNGMPLMVYHPQDGNGRHISARTPQASQHNVGSIYNAKVNGKLIAEAWFDEETTRRVDPRVLTALEAGESIELSTGLYTDNELATEGSEDKGVPYKFIARNYRPDHVAVLPDQRGACSLDDGCGINVNEVSHDSLEGLLRDKLSSNPGTAQAEPEGVWVVDVFDRYLIYRQDGKLYRLGYTKSRDKVTLGAGPSVEVKRIVSFKPVTNTGGDTDNKESVMTEQEHKKMVDFVIANCDYCDEEDRETLNALSDDKLKAQKAVLEKAVQTEAVVNAAKKGFTDPGGNTHTYNEEKKEWETKKKEEPVANRDRDDNKDGKSANPPKPQTEEEWFRGAPSKVRSAVHNAMQIEASEKARLIERLVANLSDEDKERLQKRLETHSLDELRDLSALAPKSEELAGFVPNYLGAAAPAGSQKRDEVDKADILPLATINWEQEQRERQKQA